METNNKRGLLALVYYTTILFMGVFSVIFGVFVARNLSVTWAKVAYFVWLALIVIAIIYDIYCVITNKRRYYSGLLLYIITIVTLVASIILFFSFSEAGIILPTGLFGYISCVFLSYFVNTLAICIYFMGNHLNAERLMM